LQILSVISLHNSQFYSRPLFALRTKTSHEFFAAANCRKVAASCPQMPSSKSSVFVVTIPFTYGDTGEAGSERIESMTERLPNLHAYAYYVVQENFIDSTWMIVRFKGKITLGEAKELFKALSVSNYVGDCEVKFASVPQQIAFSRRELRILRGPFSWEPPHGEYGEVAGPFEFRVDDSSALGVFYVNIPALGEWPWVRTVREITNLHGPANANANASLHWILVEDNGGCSTPTGVGNALRSLANVVYCDVTISAIVGGAATGTMINNFGYNRIDADRNAEHLLINFTKESCESGDCSHFDVMMYCGQMTERWASVVVLAHRLPCFPGSSTCNVMRMDDKKMPLVLGAHVLRCSCANP
jgi:hypothetical protein